MGADEVPATVAAVALPDVVVDQSRTNVIAAVKTSAIDSKNKLVGFQGDFTFDERVVTFQSEPVRKAGITGGNWNVAGNVLPGTGPIRTLRISAYSNDFKPLSGSGTLFELEMIKVNKTTQSTQLIWAASPDHFIFIDADLKTQKPGNAAPGRFQRALRVAHLRVAAGAFLRRLEPGVERSETPGCHDNQTRKKPLPRGGGDIHVVFVGDTFSVTPCQGLDCLLMDGSRSSAALHSGLYSFAPPALGFRSQESTRRILATTDRGHAEACPSGGTRFRASSCWSIDPQIRT